MIAPSAQYDGLSFFPDGYLQRRAQARANRLCGGLLLVALCGVSTTYAIAERANSRLRTEHAQVTADFNREADRLSRLKTMQSDLSALERRAMLAESLVEKTPRSAILTELRELLPEDASLVELALTSRMRPEPIKTPEQLLAEKRNPKAAQPITPKTYDVGMRLGGIAFTDVQVAQYISRLARSRFFDDVNLIYSRDLTVKGQPVRRFDVELTVRPVPRPIEPSTERAGDIATRAVVATETTLLR